MLVHLLDLDIPTKFIIGNGEGAVFHEMGGRGNRSALNTGICFMDGAPARLFIRAVIGCLDEMLRIEIFRDE
jgi:hypothetical protein